MSEDIFQGYKGRSLELLQKYHARVWDQVEIDTKRGLFEGTILPRSESDDDLHIVLKIAVDCEVIPIKFAGVRRLNAFEST